MTTAELAERWRMTTRTLERWRAERYGPAWHTIGGKVLYLLADVQAYEGRHRRKGG
ncbi:helix-turn-helix domain-containing protein [Paragemmobacter kunshanensis]|uniref:helix-turn-helix domain-containing protein n=1 Tax=Paragemmobacter kunshanensis TaxID=2583234 RepID=UPI001F49E746|nr:helix-turn-helix domain-containing protein [Rhodobacter kunshanensis]